MIMVPKGCVEAYMVKDVKQTVIGDRFTYMYVSEDTNVAVDPINHIAYHLGYRLQLKKSDYSVTV